MTQALIEALKTADSSEELAEKLRLCLARVGPTAFVQSTAEMLGHLERGGFDELAQDLALVFGLLLPEIDQATVRARRRTLQAIGGAQRNLRPAPRRGIRVRDLAEARPSRLR